MVKRKANIGRYTRKSKHRRVSQQLWANSCRICGLRFRHRKRFLLIEAMLPIIFVIVLGVMVKIEPLRHRRGQVRSTTDEIPASTTVIVWIVLHNTWKRIDILMKDLRIALSERVGKAVHVSHRYATYTNSYLSAVQKLYEEGGKKTPHMIVCISACKKSARRSNARLCEATVIPTDDPPQKSKYRAALREELLSSFIFSFYTFVMTNEDLLSNVSSVNIASKAQLFKTSAKIYSSTLFLMTWLYVSVTYHNMMTIYILVNDRRNRFDEALLFITRREWPYTASWYTLAIGQATVLTLFYGLPAILIIMPQVGNLDHWHCAFILFIYATSTLTFFISVCLLTRKVVLAMALCLCASLTLQVMTMVLTLLRPFRHHTYLLALWNAGMCTLVGCDADKLKFKGIWRDFHIIFSIVSAIMLVLSLNILLHFLAKKAIIKVSTKQHIVPINIVRSADIIRFDKICKTKGFGYARRRVLKNFTLAVREGETTVVLGHKGIWKTCLLNILMDVCSPHSGSICLDNTITVKSIVMCPSYDFLVSRMTVRQTFTFFAKVRASGRKYVVTKMISLIKEFRLEKDLNTRMDLLSLSKRKLVALGILFLQEAEVYVLDDPTKDLSQAQLAVAQKAIARRHRSRTVLIIASQPDDIIYLADQLALVAESEIVFVGSARTAQKRIGVGIRLIIRASQSCPVDVLVTYLRLFAPTLTHLRFMTQFLRSRLKEHHFLIPYDNLKYIEYIFANLSKRKYHFHIKSFALADTSLQDLHRKADNTRILKLMLRNHNMPMRTVSVTEASDILKRKLRLSKSDPEVTFTRIFTERDNQVGAPAYKAEQHDVEDMRKVMTLMGRTPPGRMTLTKAFGITKVSSTSIRK